MIRAIPLLLFLAATAPGQTPKAPPPGRAEVSTVAVTVPRYEPVATVNTPAAAAPIVCPLGRFVVLLPTTDEKISYHPPGVVKRYPVGTPLVHHTKWDEPAGAAPRDYTFPEAKGHVAFLFPTKDVTVSVWKNGDDGPVLVQTIDVRVGQGPRPPPEPPVPPGPIDPPAPTPTSLYFMVVRVDGPADAAFVRTMADPAWADLRKAGHLVKDFTLTDARRLGTTIPDGSTLPAVVTLSVSADGKKSTVVRDAIPLPTTTDAIRNLPEGIDR